MNDTSRKQGWAITGGAIFLGLLFIAGILNGSYAALAIPVAILTLFALGLVAWVGHTIATVQVEAETPIPEAPVTNTDTSTDTAAAPSAAAAVEADPAREATPE